MEKLLVPDWLLAAFNELGQAEIPGPEANARIALYLKTVGEPGNDEIPWCAAFVNFCLFAGQVSGTGKPNALSYLNWGKETLPRLGAVAVMKRGTEAWQGHVAFVAQVNYETVYLIGGNQGDRVSITSVAKAKIISYRWPVPVVG